MKLEGQQEAARIALANMSPRMIRLAELEKWALGTQYKGRPNWWDDKVPLWEREPCVVYPVVRIAASSNTDLCLGEGKFPSFSVGHTGKDKPSDEATPIEDCLGHYHRLSRFVAACREAFDAAQVTGTAVAVHGVRNGIPKNELQPAQWCTPEFDADGKVTKLEIKYPYIEEYKDASGKWLCRAMLYRRVIDETDDTVYKPAEAREDGREPSWQKDAAQSGPHGLGFCPVVWYAFMKGCQPVNVIDGKPIHEWITDEIQAHDIARSQWHRGALLSEPQPYEIGVTPGYNPTDAGRTAMVPTTEHGGPASPNNPIRGAFVDQPRSKSARKRGPGYVWQYTNPETKVDVLTYPSDALKAQQDNCSDLRIKLQEALAVVFLDPENIKFAATTSGKALEAIKQKQLDRCNQYRDDFRDGFLVPCVLMQIRILRTLGTSMRIPGASEALAALGQQEFSDPDIEVKWGAYFVPDPQEQQHIVDLVQKALGGGASGAERLVTKKIAVEKIARIFDIQDVERVLEELEDEQAELDEREIEKTAAELKAAHEVSGASRADRGAGARGGANPPAPGGGRGGPPAASKQARP